MNNRYAFKMLLRSPVKTALTVLLLAVACFLLLDNLSSYAMQTQAMREAKQKVEGVLTVERSPVSKPVTGATGSFLLTDPTNPGTFYYASEEDLHHEALTSVDLEVLEALPYIDAVDKRYMTAGLSKEYRRIPGSLNDYGYTDRMVIEATVSGYEDYTRLYLDFTGADDSSDGVRTFYLKDVTLLAGDQSKLEQIQKIKAGKVPLLVYAMREDYIGTDPSIIMYEGSGGNTVTCWDYDISREQMLSIQKDRRYVFVARIPSAISANSERTGLFLGDDSRKGWWPYWTDITDLPEDYLETEEFAPLRELIQVTNDDLHTFDVVYEGY